MTDPRWEDPSRLSRPDTFDSLGARSLGPVGPGEYVAPKYEQRPERAAGSGLRTLAVYVGVPLLVIVAAVAGVRYYHASAEAALVAQATDVIDGFYSDLAAGKVSAAVENVCPLSGEQRGNLLAIPDFGSQQYQAAQAAGVTTGAGMFAVTDATVAEMPPPPGSAAFKQPDPTVFDFIAAPAYKTWVVVDGVAQMTSVGALPTSIHVLLGPSEPCMAVLREDVHDAASMRSAGSAKEFKLANPMPEASK